MRLCAKQFLIDSPGTVIYSRIHVLTRYPGRKDSLRKLLPVCGTSAPNRNLLKRPVSDSLADGARVQERHSMEQTAPTCSSTRLLHPSLRMLLAIHEPHVVKGPFVHALKIALEARADLEIVDVRQAGDKHESAGVREYLEKWNVLETASKRSDVAAAGIRVRKTVRSGNSKRLLIPHMENRDRDLLVMGTERRSRHGGMFGNSLAAFCARHFRGTTLFVPSGVRPFVDDATGAVSLKKVVIPVKDERSFTTAVNCLGRLLDLLGSGDRGLEVITVHAGTGFPALNEADYPDFHWKQELRGEKALEAICIAADMHRADLVVMATGGRITLQKRLFGSTTEQVLGNISCPVLAVPISARAQGL